MQVWQKGPFRIVVEAGDDDPPRPAEYSVDLRVDIDQIAQQAGLGGTTVTAAKDAFTALQKIENVIARELGALAPEVRDTIRNEVAKKIPGLAKALGWGG